MLAGNGMGFFGKHGMEVLGKCAMGVPCKDADDTVAPCICAGPVDEGDRMGHVGRCGFLGSVLPYVEVTIFTGGSD